MLAVVATIRPTESPWRDHTVGGVWGCNRCLGANVLPVAINAGGIWERGTWAKAPALPNLVAKPGALLLWVPAAMLPGFRPRGSENGRPTRIGEKSKTWHPNRLNINTDRLNLIDVTVWVLQMDLGMATIGQIMGLQPKERILSTARTHWNQLEIKASQRGNRSTKLYPSLRLGKTTAWCHRRIIYSEFRMTFCADISSRGG
jgi:hypothetical protein